MEPISSRVAAVIVDYNVGEFLVECVNSVANEGPYPLVIVDNSVNASSRMAIDRATYEEERDRSRVTNLTQRKDEIVFVEPGRNLGYGSGANRGVAAVLGAVKPPRIVANSTDSNVDDSVSSIEYVLICNSDISMEPGAIATMTAALDLHPTWALVGPRILTTEGTTYPSARPFPSMLDAAGHVLLSMIRPKNRFTERYRPNISLDAKVEVVDWVSGACMLVRANAFEDLGGFDEAYFMFAEDMDLCWRAGQAGWQVGFVPGASVMHVHGASTRQNPYKMILEHHRSALRFANQTLKGWHRAGLPAAALVLAIRLAMACVNEWLTS